MPRVRGVLNEAGFVDGKIKVMMGAPCSWPLPLSEFGSETPIATRVAENGTMLTLPSRTPPVSSRHCNINLMEAPFPQLERHAS